MNFMYTADGKTVVRMRKKETGKNKTLEYRSWCIWGFNQNI